MKIPKLIAVGMTVAILTGSAPGWAEEIQPDELSSIPVDIKPDQTVRLTLGATSTNFHTDGCGVSVRFVNADRKTMRAFETTLVLCLRS